jgi:hypothetical protein
VDRKRHKTRTIRSWPRYTSAVTERPTEFSESHLVRTALSKHGHGFHFAVVNRLKQLRTNRESEWFVDAVEFPFEVRDHAGHADVVLQADGAVGVVECKKSRDGLGIWCFAKSNLVSRVAGAAQAVSLEGVHRLNPEPPLYACLRTGHHPTARQYNVCVELKNGKGGKDDAGRGALSDAVTQALRSDSGIVRQFIARPTLLRGARGAEALVVPIIVTNARLIACRTDLADTDIATGSLPTELHLAECDWVWYRTMASPHVRHEYSYTGSRKGATFGELQDDMYARSIAVCTPDSLRECLRGILRQAGKEAASEQGP